MANKRLNITISEKFYDLLSERAEYLGTSASALLVTYAMEYLEQKQMFTQMPNMIKDMTAFTDNTAKLKGDVTGDILKFMDMLKGTASDADGQGTE